MDEPPVEYDGSWKYGLECMLGHAMLLFFPRVYELIDWSREIEFLNTELVTITGAPKARKGIVDQLVRVWAKDGISLTLIIHIEVQSQRQRGFPKRMYRYHYRIFDHFTRFPISLAILGDNHPDWRPRIYRRNIAGCRIRFEFPSVKLIDFRGKEEELRNSDNPFAMVVLAHLKTLDTKGQPNDRLEAKKELVKSLYDKGFTLEQVQQLFRVIDDMIKLSPERQLLFRDDLFAFEEGRKMPFLSPTEINAINKGRAEGRAEGIDLGRAEGIDLGRAEGIDLGRAEGIDLGRAEGIDLGRAEILTSLLPSLKTLIKVSLEARFGEEGLHLMQAIRESNDLELLQKIVETLESASTIQEVQAVILKDNTKN